MRDKAPPPAARPAGRRAFLRAAGVAAAGAAVSGARPRPLPGGARYPLYIPPTLSPASHAFTAAPATVDIGGAQPTAWTYGGLFPGPTFRAGVGSAASIQLTNGLPDETTIHWHGMVVPHDQDGHPMDAIAPGGDYTYQYPIMQRAALNWYHPHPHGLTGQQVAMGLAGLFILNDDEEARLGLPSGPFEVPLVLRDCELDRNGDLTYFHRSTGFLGSIPLVNGTRRPRLDLSASLYRFRVLNGANARVFHLALDGGLPLTVIGNDGGLLEAPAQVASILFSPGERLDLLADFRNVPLGAQVMLRDLSTGWDLLELHVARHGTREGWIPDRLSVIPPLTNPVVTRTFVFQNLTMINGQVFEMDRIDWQVPLGQVERWRFTASGGAPHPVHVHATPFQVVSRTGGRGQVYPWERGWKDTVLLLEGETVEVLIRFDVYRGVFLMHCHKLEHEDMGMMANFEVI